MDIKAILIEPSIHLAKICREIGLTNGKIYGRYQTRKSLPFWAEMLC